MNNKTLRFELTTNQGIKQKVNGIILCKDNRGFDFLDEQGNCHHINKKSNYELKLRKAYRDDIYDE